MAMPAYEPRRKRNTMSGVLLGALVLFLICIGGTVFAALSDDSTPPPAAPTFDPTNHSTQPPQTLAPTVAPTTPAAERPAPTTAAAKAPAPTIAGDDLVEVGSDVPAGTYRAIEPVDPAAMCYWKKSKDAEGSNIIDNDLPPGGRPLVTLKKGQWFTSQGCPTWRKQ